MADEDGDEELFDVSDLVMDKSNQSHNMNKNSHNLDEVTFSEESSEDQASLSIPWDQLNQSIESRPNSSLGTQVVFI